MKEARFRSLMLETAAQEVTAGCWLWPKFIRKDGYGMVKFGGKSDAPHRVAYRIFVGPIPGGCTIDHLCWVRNCCNPHHLRLLPVLENSTRQRSFLKQKSECRHGHPLSGANLYVRNGWKCCKACNRERARRYEAKKRMAA